MIRLALAVVVAFTFAIPSQAQNSVEPAAPPPPYTGAYQPRGVDEIGIWREDDESEQALVNSSIVIRDEAMNAYVKGVLCAAIGFDRCKAARVYILREPSFNASMSPNGTMRVFSGLLLRARNEAELASVLGHEFGHFERRHTLAKFKALRSGTDILSWALILASMSNSSDVRRSFGDLRYSVYGSLFRFSRDQEREADLIGLGYMNASTLRPQAASRIWRNLIGELEASAAARGLKRPRFDRVAFTASHPPEAERARYLDALANPEADHRDEGTDRYRIALAKWLPVFLDDQIKLNDFGASEYLIDALAQNGWTATLWYARGELFRSRGAPRDFANAAEFYANAIALEPDLAEAHRGLGLSLIKSGRLTEGCASLKQYLRA